MDTWLTEIFGTNKPVIAVLQLTSPITRPSVSGSGLGQLILEQARSDLATLQAGGVHGVVISNEFQLPFLTRAEPISAQAMARMVDELLPDLMLPLGISVLWDGQTSSRIAHATGAKFIKEVYSGIYASRFGLQEPAIPGMTRFRTSLPDDDVQLVLSIPESSIAACENYQTTSMLFSNRPAALCVSGLTATTPPNLDAVARLSDVTDTPVLINTGTTAENIADQLGVCDGVLVGNYFRADGRSTNPIDPHRVNRLVTAASRKRAMP